VRGCWLFHSLPVPENHSAYGHLPMFQLIVEVKRPAKVSIHNKNFTLLNFVKLFLGDKIIYHNCVMAFPHQKIEIHFMEVICGKCAKPFSVYQQIKSFKSDCGRTLGYQDKYREEQNFNFIAHPEIYALAKLRSIEKQHTIPLAELNPNKRSAIIHDVFRCPDCQAVFSNLDLSKTYARRVSHDYLFPDVTFTNPPFVYERGEIDDKKGGSRGYDLQGHWCYPQNGVFCVSKR